MNEIEFEAAHEEEWRALQAALGKPKQGAPAAAIGAREVPHRFRRLVAHLALARDRQYRTSLIDRLHALVISAHLAVHGARAQRGHGGLAALWHFFTAEFPARTRAEWPYVLASGLAFFVPFLGIIAAIQWHPDFVYYLVAPDTLAKIQSMYAPGNMSLGPGREAGTDSMMFGYYIANNVRIDLQCLAGGIFFGLGTLAALIGNGAFLGAVAGHLTQVGYGENFWGFVAGHSAPELFGLVLAGAAGLRIGHALVAPGRQTRAAALRASGRHAAVLLYGAAMMTVCAAIIEAFWSSRTSIPFEWKIAFGSAVGVVTLLYFAFGGRTRGS
jgi:uncharacterized membrane protein SpoIIM required for sporulation